jgi:hypothetical protein
MDRFDELIEKLLGHMRDGKLIVRTHSQVGAEGSRIHNYHHSVELLALTDGRLWRVIYYGQDGREMVDLITNFPGIWYRSYDPQDRSAIREFLAEQWEGKHPKWVNDIPNMFYSSTYGRLDSVRMSDHASLRAYAQLMVLWALLRRDYCLRTEKEISLSLKNSEQPPKDVIATISRRLNGLMGQEERHIESMMKFIG